MHYKQDANENRELNTLAKEIDMKGIQQTSGATANNIQAVADMLDDLELDSLESGDTDEIEVIEDLVETAPAAEVIADPTPISDDELEASVDIEELEVALDRDENYSAQESEVQTAENASETIAAAKAKPQKRTASASSTPRAPATPRTPRDLASLEAQHFVLEGDASAMSQEDLDKNKAAVLAAVPAQKKIAEKFENLFIAVAMSKQPSVYVKQAFKLLDEKKTVTSADIVGMFKGSYSQGTAQSQAGQIMTLFAAVKIADRAKNTLTLNANSVIAGKLREIYANAGGAGA